MEEKAEQVMIGSSSFYKLKEFVLPDDVSKGHYCFITSQYENSMALEEKIQFSEMICKERLKIITLFVGDVNNPKMIYLVADLDTLPENEFHEKLTKILDKLKMYRIDTIPSGSVWRLKPNCVNQACLYKMNGELWYLYS